ncbi:MAG: 3-hydroxyacyl-CoA dehydrogenase/enoyl-CoA hydratase/3-hydroxybutyryl-CoA epimerase [Polaribacter sp.]|jgi:3-hydroxyacyl-CoA dehydrogenase/enoyl-CoA hydratase/3-hydroxybutyryl-CoA epimerase
MRILEQLKMTKKNQSAFSLEIADNGVAWVTLDVKGESQNTLRAEFAEEFETIFETIKLNTSVKALVIISAKESCFIAGADITMLQDLKTADDVLAVANTGHELFGKMEQLNMPIIAAINGSCLGGGLELAMACSYRISTDDASSRFGLPEVQLGLLPGGGGTQRLPRLVGIATSLDLMLTGKQLIAKKAKSLGIVDELVAKANLRKAAEKVALKLVGKDKRITSALKLKIKPNMILSVAGLQQLALETTQMGRKVIFDKALETVNRKTMGNYPSPEKIINAVKIGMDEGFSAGLKAEAQGFAELVMSPVAKQLMNIFFASNELKKDTGVAGKVDLIPINRVGILGGGLMGAGIAYVTADKAKYKVRVKDQNTEGVNHALKYCWDLYKKRIKRKQLTVTDANKRFSQITGTTDYQGFKRCEIVIEAVFESLELKQQMLKDIEKNCGDNVIFASNTSSIPITKIAEGANHPENVIGLHYFSPVDKMPLLEIIITDKTSPEVIASCVEFGKKQGKTVIVVKDGTGFYTSRIVGPFVNEAGHLVSEGVAIDKIDNALKKAGYPVGPITLLDEVGIDVGTKIAPIMAAEFGDRMLPPAIFTKLAGDDRKGRKNKRGFYDYSGKSNKKEVDQSIYALLGVTPDNQMDEQQIADRCILQMVNESVLCLQEGILNSPRDGDIGAIFGLGFPPFLGGPFRYVDALGAKVVVEKMLALKGTCGERFEPAKMLVDMANAEGGVRDSFY